MFLALLSASLSTSLSMPMVWGSNCDFRLSVSNINLVWNQSLPTQQVTFSVTKRNNPPCDFAVTFSKGGTSSYERRMRSGNSQLRYQLYKESSLTNILKQDPDVTTSNDVVTGSFDNGSNQTQTLNYYVSIPYNQATEPTLKAPGAYSDSFTLRVYKFAGKLDLDGADDSANVTITTLMPRIIQLSLVPTGAAFDPNSVSQNLNFGLLTEGATRALDVRVLSNAGYSITLSSQNNSVLRHQSAGVTTTIPYALTLNGTSKNLSSSASSPVVVAAGNGQTTMSGAANSVAITIGSVDGKVAGSYSDNITVTTATTE